MSRRLIVNADDLGLSPGVNQGILEAHQRGILTSTTAMVNMPAVEAGIHLLQQEAPPMGIGLHFNLTTGQPVLPPEQVPSLVQDGKFPYDPTNPLRFVDSLDPDDVAAEMTAQFERFIQLAGRKPDHLDAHHHSVYHLPAAFRMLLDLAHKHHLPVRNGCDWIQNAAYSGARYDQLRQILADGPAPRWPVFEAGFYDAEATVDRLRSILVNLPEGTTEVMCHPAHNDHIPQSYAAQREVELAVLTDPSVSALVEAQGIQLITFGDFARA